MSEPIKLEKDCSCIVHEGPHWIYCDTQWRKSNLRHRDTSIRGFIVEEVARLNEKEYQMRTHDVGGYEKRADGYYRLMTWQEGVDDMLATFGNTK